jgi:cephalosporin hydroxylase
MKNYHAPAGSVLRLDNGSESTSVDLYSKDGFEMLSNLWIKVGAERRVMYDVTWLGRPIIQFPTDMVLIQELLWKVRPDVVIETGVAHGGSLVFAASILELIGQGRVIGVDIEIRPHNREAITTHPLAHRISLVEGSSTAPETFAQVRQRIKKGERVAVFLDSNHSEDHVKKELELYAPLVSEGSYLVVHDGAQAWVGEIPGGRAEWLHNHPLGAIQSFLAFNKSFSVDPQYTRYGITSSPCGFLKKENGRESTGSDRT